MIPVLTSIACHLASADFPNTKGRMTRPFELVRKTLT
jgi:hypothetical protein